MEEVIVQPGNARQYIAQLGKTREALSWIWSLIGSASRRRLVRILVLVLATQLIGNLLPRGLASVVESVTDSRAAQLAISFGVIAAFLLVIGPIIELMHDRAREYFLGDLLVSLDEAIDDRLFAKSLSQHERFADKLSATRMEKGRGRILDLTSLIMFDMGGNIAGVALAYVLLPTISLGAFCIMTGVVAAYLTWSFYLNVSVSRTCGPLNQEWEEHQRMRTEKRTLIARVRVSGREAEDREFIRERSHALMERDWRFWLWFINQNMLRHLIATGGFLAAFGYGCYQAWNGLADATLLIPLFLWTKQVRDMLWTISHMEHRINYNLPAIMSMISALEMPTEMTFPDNGIVIPEGAPVTIEFEDVSYVYPNEIADLHTSEDREHPPTIHCVSFTIGAGEAVAVMGESGSGKSTLMKLLLRFMDPTSGRITVNGHDLRDLDIRSYYRAIGYVPQSPQIFNASVRDNITYALGKEERERATDPELREIAKRMRFRLDSRFTDVLDTKVGEGGVLLSGGEKQRLMLTAIAAQRPRVIVMDEATSALDSTTERYVQEGLGELLDGSAGGFIVAHRLSTVRHICTKFILLRSSAGLAPGQGQIEAVASSFEELYARSESFQRLADDQELTIPALAA